MTHTPEARLFGKLPSDKPRRRRRHPCECGHAWKMHDARGCQALKTDVPWKAGPLPCDCEHTNWRP